MKFNKPPGWEELLKDKNLCKQWVDSYMGRKVLKETTLKPDIFLKKAKHNLDFANWVYGKHEKEIKSLFKDNNFYDWVICACYYSIYHSTLALMAQEKMSSKSHTATLCAVIYFYYHNQRVLEKEHIQLISASIEREDVEIINRAKSLRERASYNASETFEQTLADKSKNNAIKFLTKVQEILENL